MAERDALLVVDTTPTFCEGGGLPVSGGNAVAERIAAYVDAHAGDYAEIIPSEDWHIDAPGHIAAEGETPDFVTSFPAHGPAGEPEAMLHPALDRVRDRFTGLVRKGMHEAAFSMFEGVVVDDPDQLDPTGALLADHLHEKGITHLDVVGIATDFCVARTALDGVAEGFTVRVLEDLTAHVGEETLADARRRMAGAGVDVVDSSEVSAPTA